MYRTVVIDPPWLERGAGRIRRGADRHYALMTERQIVRMLGSSIAPLLARDCHAWIWTTNTFLGAGLRVLRKFGFRYVTNLCWVKDRIGLGQYLRGRHELCLFGVRGTTMLVAHDVPSVVFCKRAEHSQKPQAAYDAIARVSPSPRLDVFARDRHPGFDAWGNEVRVGLFDLEPVGGSPNLLRIPSASEWEPLIVECRGDL